MLNMILIVFFGEFDLPLSIQKTQSCWYCQAHPLLFEFISNLRITKYVLVYHTLQRCSEIQCYRWFNKMRGKDIEIKYVGKQKNRTLVFRSNDGYEYLHKKY